jgi:hypothetical protein
MTDLRQAAQQALESLEMLAQPTKTNSETPRYKAHKAAITALRAALAHQEQEPVARVIDDETPEGSTEWIPYSGRQVPVKTGDLLYTHPPRREWRSLSEEEINETLDNNLEGGTSLFDICRAIEQALKEKNHDVL